MRPTIQWAGIRASRLPDLKSAIICGNGRSRVKASIPMTLIPWSRSQRVLSLPSPAWEIQ